MLECLLPNHYLFSLFYQLQVLQNHVAYSGAVCPEKEQHNNLFSISQNGKIIPKF